MRVKRPYELLVEVQRGWLATYRTGKWSVASTAGNVQLHWEGIVESRSGFCNKTEIMDIMYSTQLSRGGKKRTTVYCSWRRHIQTLDYSTKHKHRKKRKKKEEETYKMENSNSYENFCSTAMEY